MRKSLCFMYLVAKSPRTNHSLPNFSKVTLSKKTKTEDSSLKKKTWGSCQKIKINFAGSAAPNSSFGTALEKTSTAT